MLVIPSIHPAAVLRGQDTGTTAKFKDTIVSDFRKAAALLNRLPTWEESAIWKRSPGERWISLFPTVEEVADWFRRHRGQMMAVDTETTGSEALDCQLICIGFATEDGDAINFPVLKQGGHAYWSGADWERVLPIIREALAATWWPKVLHNGAFDFLALWRHNLLLDGWTDDTMLMHHVDDGELPHSLAYVVSRYLELAYYKDDVKGDVKWLDLDDVTLRSYNLRDVLSTVRALPELRKEMLKWKLERLYRAEMALAKVMLRGTIKGLMVDLERRDSLKPIQDQFKLDKKGKPTTDPNPDWGYPSGLGPRMEARRQEGLHELKLIAGHPDFNPASPIQLRWLLYDQLKFPILKRSEKTNAPSTDKEAMVLLSIHAGDGQQRHALKNLAKWRRADKILGTWIRGLHVLGDGRVHPSWKIHGTVSGRLSSSPNFQNFNKPIKRIFMAAPGSKFVGVDLSQAELRVMAYLSQDPELLRMYEDGLNVHTINATLLFQVRNPGADTNAATEAYLTMMVPKLLGRNYSDLPLAPVDKWSRIRRLAKNFVFACHDSETLITVKGCGAKAIKDVKKGDWVATFDFTTGRRMWARVRVVKCHGFRQCIRVRTLRTSGWRFQEEEIITTPEHMMVMADGDLREVGTLKVGEELKWYEWDPEKGKQRRGFDCPQEITSVEVIDQREVWDLEVDHRDHNYILNNGLVSGNCLYGAMPETIYDTLHSERDPETDEPMFPDLELGLIEALKLTWEMLHPAITTFQTQLVGAVQMQGHYRSLVSGRIRWFRGGFKRNEILNYPVQEMVAAHMERVVEIAHYLDQATGWGSVINSQVHDAVNAESEDRYVKVTSEIFSYVLNRPFVIPSITDNAVLPADTATVGTHLDQV